MPDWSTSCPDWGQRLIDGRSIIPPPIFPEQADIALEVFKELTIVDATGSPKFGDACAQWVFDLVASIFGAYDAETGARLITEWFILVPKKNSKSTVAAGVMLTALILNWRKSAAFTILSPTKEIAGNSYNPASDMVKHEEELNSLMHVQGHIKAITHLETNATLKVLAADSNTVGGTKSVGILIDELHLFGKMPNAENMFREATGGLASRPEGFVVWLTTQSDEPPAGVFKEKLQYARDVRDGVIIDKGFVPIIFEHPRFMVEKKEHLLLENLGIVNPNLGYSVNRDFLNREFMKAEVEGKIPGFLAKHGNVEIGLALRSGRWAGTDFWDQNVAIVTLEKIFETSDVITAGVDGGGLDDMLGLAILGRDREDNNLWRAWFKAWIHPIALERRKSEATKYHDFADDGDLVIVEHIGEDVDQCCDIIMQCDQSGLLERIGVDPSGIAEIVNKLKLPPHNLEEDRIVGVTQGWRLTSSIKDTERKVAAGELVHGGSPLMNWCVSNAKAEPKGNAMLITKQASGTGKIDPLMALFSAVALMVLNPEARNGGSIYDKRGILSI